jgi:hypothetical protein
MLAVTHHFMMQYSAYCLGKSKFHQWFEGYEILGDDIVIFDHDIAKFYLRLCEDLGVSINLSKSVIANRPSLEFAKQSSLGDYNVSPLSFKEMIQTNNFFGRLQQTMRLIERR